MTSCDDTSLSNGLTFCKAIGPSISESINSNDIYSCEVNLFAVFKIQFGFKLDIETKWDWPPYPFDD